MKTNYLLAFLPASIFLLSTVGCKKNPSPPMVILPTISSINPASGAAGASVTITGTNFSTTPANNAVKFNGVAAAVTSANTTSLIVKAPVTGTTGIVSVSTKSGSADGPIFTYLVAPPAPSITSISPMSGPPNTVVTINGTNFKTNPADNIVKFNGITATVQTATSTMVTVLAPLAGTSGSVTIATADGTATGPAFNYTSAQDIYVVGRTSSGPAYWVNGVRTDMPFDCLEANAIFVDGTDIYIAGADANGPKYWKNGAGVSLPVTVGHNGGRAKSIFVSGTDVYTCGYDMVNGANALPRCWKNTTSLGVSLSSGNISGGLPVVLGYAYSIFVSGSDVYLAGSQAPFSGNQVVSYWKNGAPFPLTDGSTVAEATSVFVSGNDVYLSGYIQGSGTSAYYWKNGVPVPLNINATSSNCTPESIYVSSAGDVYVCGEVHNLAKYWKNGVMSDLTTTTPGNGIFEPAFSISGNGSDIYVAGTETGQGTGYWKNGAFNVLPAAQYVYGIVVK